jgi:hypothetical protein
MNVEVIKIVAVDLEFDFVGCTFGSTFGST